MRHEVVKIATVNRDLNNYKFSIKYLFSKGVNNTNQSKNKITQ